MKIKTVLLKLGLTRPSPPPPVTIEIAAVLLALAGVLTAFLLPPLLYQAAREELPIVAILAGIIVFLLIGISNTAGLIFAAVFVRKGALWAAVLGTVLSILFIGASRDGYSSPFADVISVVMGSAIVFMLLPPSWKYMRRTKTERAASSR